MPRLKEQPKPAFQTISVRVPLRLAEEFAQFSAAQERTVSQELRRAMRAHMGPAQRKAA